MAAQAEKKQSWELGSLIFVGRTIGVILFIGYLCATTPSAWQWGQVKWVRAQSLDTLTAVAEKSIAGDPRNLIRWLEARPSYEHAIIMEKLEPYSGKISSAIFLLYSRWTLDLGQEEEAVFWRQYGRYRLRYDALRCGAPESSKNMSGVLSIFPDSGVQKIIEKNPSIIRTSLKRVLDFDAKHPAENNPIDICPTIQKMDGGGFEMVERKYWASIRHTLRMVTEYAIEKMGEKKAKP